MCFTPECPVIDLLCIIKQSRISLNAYRLQCPLHHSVKLFALLFVRFYASTVSDRLISKGDVSFPADNIVRKLCKFFGEAIAYQPYFSCFLFIVYKEKNDSRNHYTISDSNGIKVRHLMYPPPFLCHPH